MTAITAIHDPIDVVAGRSWPFGGVLVDLNCNPLNLTGATIAWKLENLDGSANAITLSLGNGIAVVDAATATIQVLVPPSANQYLQAAAYRDWLTVTLADGAVLDMWSGIIRVSSPPL